MLRRFLILIAFIMPVAALAHSLLISVTPKDGALLKVVPSQIGMVFKSPTKLIKVEMHKHTADSKGSLLDRLLGGSKDDQVSLGKNFLMKVAEQHVIALPLLESGNYSVAWRAMGEDGHVIKGEFSFDILRN